MSNLLAVKRTNNELIKYKHVNWYIVKRCNYDCSYCSDELHDKVSERPSLEKMMTGANNIFAHIDPKDVYFDFSGGEPTIIPQFDEFIKWLKEDKKIGRVGFISNGTRKFHYYDRILQWADHITISYHFEYAKDDILLPKLVELHKKYGKKIRVQVMMNAHHYDRVVRVVEVLQENNMFYSIRKIRTKRNTPGFDSLVCDYTPEMLQWLEEAEPKQAAKKLGEALTPEGTQEIISGNILVHQDLNKFKGWHCWVGLDYFHVWFDGTFYRAGCTVGGPLGNIYDKIEFPTEPVVCTRNACYCGPEILTRKTVDLKYQDWLDVPTKK
jgi:MoaA/NifB/PqqE/SkfB family radical SAM enzyme